MAKHYGDIELIGGKIINFKIDVVDSTPLFNSDDIGLIAIDNESKDLVYNNGTEYVPLQSSKNNSNIKDFLGSTWVNDNLTINPTPVNNMEGISGIDSNSTVFDVLNKINDRIGNNQTSITSISGTTISNPSSKDVLYYNGEEFINGKLSNLIDSNFVLDFNHINVVNVSNLQNGETLEFDGTEFINTKKSYIYESQSISSTHFVNHNLNSPVVSYTVKRNDTGKEISPINVTFVDSNNATFQFDAGYAVSIIVIR